MMTPRADRDAGMTLIELLVVLAVLALLGGLLTVGLHAAAAGWQHVTLHNADREALESRNALLRGLLSQIYPAKSDKSSRVHVRFDGQSDRLDFLAPLLQRFGAQEIVRYTLRFAPNDSLHLAWQLDRQSVARADDLIPAAVDESIADCQSGSFSYFGQRDETGPPQWWNSWQEQNKLPGLVRVRSICRGSAQELVVAPLVTAAFCSVVSTGAVC